MKLLEMKNRLALQSAKIIFQNNFDVIFIGGTALNTFYLGYRYSEDIDLGYLKENKKTDIEKLLKNHGYSLQRTNYKFRDILSLDGISIKMDIVEYTKKYNGFIEKNIAETKVKTLSLEEFTIDKIISFFTREDWSGMARDAYDVFSIEREYEIVLGLATKTKDILRNNIISLDHNLQLFERDPKKIESAVVPYLKSSVEYIEVLSFLKDLQKVLK